jgi:three-Cys-motif partner protein
MKKVNPQTSLLQHSEAKVRLYGRYLSVYLNILHRAQFVKRIFVFDLFCGEGIYENDAKGSPIIALDCLRNHYFANQNSIPNMTVWFNDIGKSKLEDGYKVDRVERISKGMFIPPNVELKFSKEDYRKIFPKAIDQIRQTRDAKGIFFVDPFGYKIIKPDDIRRMLEPGSTEVLLWLPIPQMYRFAEAVSTGDFSGSDPLRDFLKELFGSSALNFVSDYDFIEQLKGRFRAYLRDLKAFVDTFTLQRDATNTYCLFFFTRNVKGYEKMVGTKWELDKEHGKGFTLEKTLTFFSEIELSEYPQKLWAYIKSEDFRTNEELFLFGLENGFLPKHTKSVLDSWKNSGQNIEVVGLDGKPVRGYYIDNLKRRVGFRVIES